MKILIAFGTRPEWIKMCIRDRVQRANIGIPFSCKAGACGTCATEILEGYEMFEFEEGCLSIPGFNETIARPDKIKLIWQNLSGETMEDTPEGILTVCIQHEIDHLDGKLMVDYVSALKRDRIRNKLLKDFR